MKHVSTGTQPTSQGAEQYFSGKVHVEALFDSSETSGGCITFEPCARRAWHTHPRGQTLLVTAGLGFVQTWGGPVEILRPGDVIWCPPDEKHWHGAAPNSTMTHIAITEKLDGKAVDWLEKVSDEEYQAAQQVTAEAASR
jgi:quercetin dioxygenase-like cupin family protein